MFNNLGWNITLTNPWYQTICYISAIIFSVIIGLIINTIIKKSQKKQANPQITIENNK